MELFPAKYVVGVFRGFTEGGMEFHADLTLPYQTVLHNTPMHGQFLLVQLESPDEAVLGRITSLSAEGKLISTAGEQYSIRAMRERREMPDQLRADYLTYRVDIRVLGVLRLNGDGKPIFVPSHRRLPHVGAPVAFLSDELLRVCVGHDSPGAEIGFFALGEYVYAGKNPFLQAEEFVQIQDLEALVRFPIESLVARRTFVFARAGYGKSNLTKYLFSRLYQQTPHKKRRKGNVPVGTVIFDPDGEYFWPDVNGNPGLCDVPALHDKIVVFTSQAEPSPFYGSFKVGGVKLDIRRLNPSDVISIALPPERQDQQNVRKLRGMSLTNWAALVDLIDQHRLSADIKEVQDLIGLESDQLAEALAARANMWSIVSTLHDRKSQLMDILLHALAEGKLCIIDVSQLRGGPALILSGLILRRIFDHNQSEFTKANPNVIPTIAVVEEAQSVLNDKSSASAPYVEWVKEGRKYDLGAFLITQQPGSIPNELLSQGDNWFIFHLLSEADLQNVRKANAHFSKDILSSLLNEPIHGQGVFWSGVSEMKYPISLRVLSFRNQYPVFDPNYDKPCQKFYARKLTEEFGMDVPATVEAVGAANEYVAEADVDPSGTPSPTEYVDPFRQAIEKAKTAIRARRDLLEQVESGKGLPWGVLFYAFKEQLPEKLDGRDKVANSLIPELLNELYGHQGTSWDTERRGAKNTLYVFKKR